MNPPRKPSASNGKALPELMAQLGVTSWTNVPNPILERWMEPDNPARLRVMAALVRHSFGYQRPYAVHMVKGKERPLQQADLARMLGMQDRWLRKVLAEIKSEGLVEARGKLLIPVATPPKNRSKSALPAFSSPFASSSPSGGDGDDPLLTDPEYAREVAEIKRDYLRELCEAKGRMAKRLALARAQAEERAKGEQKTKRADLNLKEGADLAPPIRKESEKKEEEAGGRARVEEDRSSSPPAFPSLEVEELHHYLEGLSHLIGTAPDPAETAEIHARLKPASIGLFQTHVQNRLARGFRPRGWRVFRQLAADCAASGKAFAAAPAKPVAVAEPEKEKLRRLKRAMGLPEKGAL